MDGDDADSTSYAIAVAPLDDSSVTDSPRLDEDDEATAAEDASSERPTLIDLASLDAPELTLDAPELTLDAPETMSPLSTRSYHIKMGSPDDAIASHGHVSFQLQQALEGLLTQLSVTSLGPVVLWRWDHLKLAQHLFFVCIQVRYSEHDSPVAVVPWQPLDTLLNVTTTRFQLAPASSSVHFRFGVATSLPTDASDAVLFAPWEVVPRRSGLPLPAVESDASSATFSWPTWPIALLHCATLQLEQCVGDDDWRHAYTGVAAPVQVSGLPPQSRLVFRVRLAHCESVLGTALLGETGETSDWTLLSIVTAPTSVAFWGVHQHWWLHATLSNALASAGSWTVVVSSGDETTQQPLRSFQTPHRLLHLRRDTEYDVYLQVQSGCCVATSSPERICTSLSLRLDAVTSHATSTQLRWSKLPHWLALSAIRMELQIYTADDTWTASDVPSNHDDASSSMVADVAPRELLEVYRLTLRAGTDDVASSSPVVVVQAISLRLRGIGCHLRLEWTWALPPHLVEYSARFQIWLSRDRTPLQRLEPAPALMYDASDSNTYVTDVVLARATTYTCAVVAEIDHAFTSPLACVSYSTAWPLCTIDVVDITYESALVVLSLPTPDWCRTGLESCVEIERDGAWVNATPATVATRKDGVCRFECRLASLPSHCECLVRLGVRWSTHAFEAVAQTTFLTGSGPMTVHARNDGRLQVSWSPAPDAHAEYDIQCYVPSHRRFETRFSTRHTTYETPDLGLPLHLLWLRLQTRIGTLCELPGAPTLCLIAPSTPTLGVADARCVTLHFGGLHRTQLPPHIQVETVSYSFAPLPTDAEVDDHVHNTLTLRGLQPATRYRGRLCCTCTIDGLELVGTSADVVFRTTACAPDAPVTLHVDEIVLPVGSPWPALFVATSYLRVHWAPATPNGAPIQGYALEMAWSHDGQQLTRPWHGVYVGVEPTYCPSADDLHQHDEFVHFRLQAANAFGLSDFVLSAPLEVQSRVSGQPLPTTPTKPTRLSPLLHRHETPALLPTVSIDGLVSPCKQYLASRQLSLPPAVFQAERRRWLERETRGAPTPLDTAISLYRSQHPKHRRHQQKHLSM